MEAWDEPDRKGTAFVKSLAGSAVPSLIASIARAGDPIQRETSRDISGQAIRDSLRNRWPGAKNNLMPARDIWGQPKGVYDELGALFNPTKRTLAKNDPVASETAALNIPIALPERKINKVELTPEEYDQFAQESGQWSHKIIKERMAEPEWEGLTPGIKGAVIKKVIAAVRHEVGQKIMGKIVNTPGGRERYDSANPPIQ